MIDRIEMLTPEECDNVVQTIHTLEHEWIRRHPTAPFFTLGTASYLDKDDVYYERAQRYNPLLSEHFGWLHERLLAQLEARLGEPVSFYERFARPGFHVFGGSRMLLETPSASVHCDVQYQRLDWAGLENPDFEHPLSMTLTIKLPASGGGLRVWDIEYQEIVNRPAAELRPIFRERTRHYEPYQAGVMVMHSGHQVHQIAPSDNITKADERLTLQAHGIKCRDGWCIYW